MFEINLVPDIKADMLRKQRMSNLVLFICIIVAAASAGIVLLLGSVVGAQNLNLANQDREIDCRSTGSGKFGKCDSDPKKDGTPILKFENVNDFLTIQDQMKRLSVVNKNKLLLSRVFGVLDVLLPTGDETVVISELTVDFATTSLTFEAQGDSISRIDYKALEVFNKSAARSYYDFGRYYRTDSNGDQVEIPTMCITESVVNGTLYGIYHKGQKGCEAPLIPETATDEENTENTENTDEDETNATPETPTNEVIDIPIRRVYSSKKDMDDYIADNKDNGGGFFFKSACIQYDEGTGRYSESATLLECPLLSAEPNIRDSSNGRDSNDNLVLRFNATVSIKKEVFTFANKHMRVVGPSRQNVTDSYTQIRDMFTERAADCEPDDTQCMEANTNGN